MIAIIDYKVGNLYSVKRAIDFLGAQSVVTNNHEDILNAEKIILPGVGAFSQGMENLKNLGLDRVIIECARQNKIVLGICLGMQLLLSESEELGHTLGLNLIPGSVKYLSNSNKLKPNTKIPHIGWNNMGVMGPSNFTQGMTNKDCLYFNHSLYTDVSDGSSVLGVTEYGDFEFPVIIRNNNIYGCQFHPEKSGEVGLKMLANFIKLDGGKIQ